jgi:hypothetical protein
MSWCRESGTAGESQMRAGKGVLVGGMGVAAAWVEE